MQGRIYSYSESKDSFIKALKVLEAARVKKIDDVIYTDDIWVGHAFIF